jgi:hypothetical protein
MIGLDGGRIKPLSLIPFSIEGKTYRLLAHGQPAIYAVGRTQSDVWVIENFDQIIK